MGRFFKNLFKSDNEGFDKKEDDELINRMAEEIMAEESIKAEQPSISTNKLPNLPEHETAEVLLDFSTYKVYSSSNPGMIKENNQDSILTASFSCHTNGERMILGMGIVADGMGGLAMGEIASAAAIGSVSTFMQARIAEYILEGVPSSDRIMTQIISAIQNANSIVKEKGEELGEDIGTTMTFGLFIKDKAYFGQVGDSRAYIVDTKTKTIEKITRDHSLVQRLVDMGQLTEKEVKNHPRRNEIYRSLGLRDSVEVDTYSMKLNKDSIIVMVSDGLWEFAEDEDILNELLTSRELAEVPEKLIAIANGNGGHDNISVVIIKPE